ncbi:COX15/CtaA family protein [Tundrisphaera sp. TA3]|uniref:COX15/CtaA family protein n=1 Tax=Tundrisphaera sp. TA3 TaxID=3435775 RepID=UPI003EB864F8
MHDPSRSEPSPTAGPAPGSGYRAGPHWMALLATAFTWPLLFVGGLVTTYRVGMAVPDWPTTFGVNMFLFNMFDTNWGVFGEHAHRLYASAVGLFTIVLMLDFLLFERRARVKWLGVLALVAVIAQGVMGGMRVRWNWTGLAAFHGVFGQAFFAFMVALCVLTGRGWFGPARTAEGAGKARRMVASALGLIAAQIMAGAWLRHYPSRMSLVVHSLAAVLVLGHVGAVASKYARSGSGLRELIPSARAMGLLLILQVALGIGAWWMLRPYDGNLRPVTMFQALIRTGHQANAALLLAAAVVMTMRAFGQIAPPDDERGPAARPSRELEAVA